eukprot:scpid44498/ scgid32167/ Peptide-N(4)-(N-acetyl-beta-glucosaminyl)asparagine amidase; N-glycanase 1; Peptide:N-glycanase
MASTPVWFGQLLGNDEATLKTASDILIKYIDNILANPDQPKYKCIRLENNTFKAKVLSARGALQCLKAMGFVQDPEYIVLPRDADLQKLSAMRQSLVQRTYVQPTAALPAAVAHRPSISVSPEQTRSFLQRVTTHAEHVLMYEDRSLQLKARSCIPVDRLDRAASDAVRRVEAATPNETNTISQQECLLLELMHWFKEDFFSWCDAPECVRCGAPPAQMQSIGHVAPNSDDLRYGASRVEGYRCSMCSSTGRFPRYNHPGKLLETRKGRCGEWANCFTLCCRAMGFEARHAVDWTDHVWTEVFSDRQQRWLHCDPCEDCCDKPLIYEAGWGKSLSYILAFSFEEAIDVTWRYTAKPDEVRTRRSLCDEDALRRCLDGLRTQRQRALTADRRQQLMQRCVVEALEFMSVKSADDIAGQGRTSGSMAWRLARGETSGDTGSTSAAAAAGSAAVAPTAIIETSYLFELSDGDVAAKRMRVRYSTASDAYYRQHADHLAKNDAPALRGWKSGIFMAENVQRKVENDWKMAYLARRSGGSEASATWTLDLSSHSCTVDRASVCVKGDVFGSGRISWSVSADNGALVELDSNSQGGAMPELDGATMITVTASMQGGDGDVAWQHTQLFRQSSEEKLLCPLDIDLSVRSS